MNPCETCTGACCHCSGDGPVPITALDRERWEKAWGVGGAASFMDRHVIDHGKGYVGRMRIVELLTLSSGTVRGCCQSRDDGCAIYELRPDGCRAFDPQKECMGEHGEPRPPYKPDPAKIAGRVKLRVVT
jgi:Fe-S-cluster containining protein